MRGYVPLPGVVFPLFLFVACATGVDVPEQASPIVTAVDSGPPSPSIHASDTTTTADAAPPVSSQPDAAANDTGADVDDSADAASDDVVVTPPGPTTPACDMSNPQYGVFIIALGLTGNTPPACISGECNASECCYDAKYCVPE
jgi:hypothetical protein